MASLPLARRILEAALPLLVACRSHASDPADPGTPGPPSAAPPASASAPAAAASPPPSTPPAPTFYTIPMPSHPEYPKGQVVTKKELREWVATEPMPYCGPGPIRHNARYTGPPTLDSKCYGSPDNTCLDKKAPQLRRLMLADSYQRSECLVEGPTAIPARPQPQAVLLKAGEKPKPPPYQWCCYTLLTPGMGRPLVAQGASRLASLKAQTWG